MHNNFEKFFALYALELERAINAFPNDYSYSKDTLPEVLQRMKIAILKGSFNKDSQTFKAVCKHLKIPHTYKAIAEYIKGDA